MTRHQAKAVTLLSVLVIVFCVGILGNMAAFVLNRALIVQRGTVSWSNDDAVVDGLMRALRRDVNSATTAHIDKSGTLVLLDTRTGAKVLYAQTGDVTTRTADPSAAKARPNTWTLRRSSLRWTIEPTTTGAALVWIGVEIRETRPHNRHQPPSVLNRYAIALRVGSNAPEENRR